MPLPREIDDDEAFDQLYELLRAIAAGQGTDRSEAVRYSACRAILLASSRRDVLPGFVLQCLSVARFRDFITLYDPNPEVRERFIRGAFKLTRERLDVLSAFDAPAQARSVSGGWSL